jgi:multiphosphoryl transfer protein
VTISKDGREVNASSVLSVLTLDCHQGDEITVTVEGEDAEATLDELVALIESGLGEGIGMTTILTGRAAAPGAAVAPVFVLETDVGHSPIPERRRDRPPPRWHGCARAGDGREQLEELAVKVAEEAGEDEAEIFEAHAEFAADPELLNLADRGDRGRRVRRAGRHLGVRHLPRPAVRVVSEYLAARAPTSTTSATGSSRSCRAARCWCRPQGAVGDRRRELTPSQTASLPRELIAALVTETGSPTSHAAILARSLGIPAIVGCEGLLDGGHRTTVAVDGRTGELFIDPDEAAVRRDHRSRIAGRPARDASWSPRDRAGPHRRRPPRRARRQPRQPRRPRPGAVAAGAEGSGLVRTEFLFQDRRTEPDVDDQVGFYTQVLEAFPATGSCSAPWTSAPTSRCRSSTATPEENPALGLRGIRLHLARPELFRDQLRALLRARAAVADRGRRHGWRSCSRWSPSSRARSRPGPTSTRSPRRRASTSTASRSGDDRGPLRGARPRRLAEHVDFLSIGTNDLLQYLFAADRLHGGVADIADIFEPDVLRSSATSSPPATPAAPGSAICGEAASDPSSPPRSSASVPTSCR